MMMENENKINMKTSWKKIIKVKGVCDKEIDHNSLMS